MNTVLKTSLMTGLLLLVSQSGHADDSDKTALASQELTQEAPVLGQSILAPTSPFFSSNINLYVESDEESLKLEGRILELETALENNQNQSNDLIEELHATAKNADLEIETYEKTVAQLKETNSSNDKKIQSLEDAYTALSKERETLNSEIVTLKEQLASLEKVKEDLSASQLAVKESNEKNTVFQAKIVELENSSKTLKSQLDKMQQEDSEQLRKLGLLDQSTSELKALQSAYKERNDEAASIKAEKNDLESLNIALLSRIEQLVNDANTNNTKMGLLSQTTTELKTSTQERDNEIAVLQSKLKGAEVESGLLIAQIEKLNADANQSSEKLGLLNQASLDKNNEVTVLKSKLKGAEVDSQLLTTQAENLKVKIAELDDANKTFQSKITQLESDAAESTRKLGMLDQTSAELIALKSAYKERNDETIALKQKIAELDDANKTFQSKITQLEGNAAESTRKLGMLDQTSAELIALKSAYKERNDETIALKKQIAELDNSNKTLLSKITQFETEASNNKRKLGLLDQSNAELKSLKSAYKDRNDENIELKKRVFDINKTKENLSTELAQLKSKNSTLMAEVKKNATLKSSLDTSMLSFKALQKKFANSESTRKSLSGKISTIEKDNAGLKRQVTTLNSVNNELTSLKSAYDDLKEQKQLLDDKFAAALLDPDKDGVVEAIDQCSSSPLGSRVNNIGCPEIDDADGDNVADANDLCPNTPANTEVNKFGCLANQNITLNGVTFATGSDRLTRSSLPIVNAAAQTLKQNPDIKVEISGYTDNRGNDALNQSLSKRRANAVAIQLIEQGVRADRISSKGYGESNPIATNDTEAGRLKNRRVELKIR